MSMHDPTTVSDAVRVRKTVTSLADGRELIYFDDSPPYVTGDRTRDLVSGGPGFDRALLDALDRRGGLEQILR